MSRKQRAVCLVGSPRGIHSTSQVLGTELLDGMLQEGVSGSLWRVTEMGEQEGSYAPFRSALAEADLLVLSFPLYVDTLPADLIRVLSWLAAEGEALPLAGKHLAALVNSGFPEAAQNDIALAQCACFARQCGLRWCGGLALGGGAALNGRPLSDFGEALRHVREALREAAVALAAGEEIAAATARRMARPFMPSWAYLNQGAPKGQRPQDVGFD